MRTSRARIAPHHVVVAAAISLTALALAWAARLYDLASPLWAPRWMVDLAVYQAAGRTVLAGGSLYAMLVHTRVFGDLPFVYTPFAGLLLVPAAALSLDALSWVWNVASLICLGAVLWMSLARVGVGDWRARLAVCLPALVVAAWLLPVRTNLEFGQINLGLLLLILLDLRNPGEGRWQGIGVGIAAGVKLTPLIFVLYLLLTGRPRSAARAVVTFALTIAASFVLIPRDSWAYWGGGIFLDANRIGPAQLVYEQSLKGVLARLLHTPDVTVPWLGLAVVVGAAGIAISVHAHRRGDDFAGVLACALTALLVSPMSWEHHWVWIVPLLVWMVAGAWRARSAAGLAVAAVLLAVFTVRVYWLAAPSDDPASALRLHGWQLLATSSFVIAGTLLLALVPVWLSSWGGARRPSPARLGGDAAVTVQ